MMIVSVWITNQGFGYTSTATADVCAAFSPALLHRDDLH